MEAFQGTRTGYLAKKISNYKYKNEWEFARICREGCRKDNEMQVNFTEMQVNFTIFYYIKIWSRNYDLSYLCLIQPTR